MLYFVVTLWIDKFNERGQYRMTTQHYKSKAEAIQVAENWPHEWASVIDKRRTLGTGMCHLIVYHRGNSR